MIEKIITKDYNNGLETKNSLSKVKAIDVAGNDILVSSDIVANSGGGCRKYLSKNRLEYKKWYRIASAPSGVNPNSVLLNIGNQYVNKAASAQLFYIFADGYSDNQCVIQLASGGKCVSKMRILYKASTTEGAIIEVLTCADGNNSYYFAYSCSIGFTFQDPVEVSETPESGYSVKEFVF